MNRNKSRYRQAAERLARRWLDCAGVPRCHYGFTENAGFYLILVGFDGERVKNYCVPSGGAKVLRREVDRYIEARERAAS